MLKLLYMKEKGSAMGIFYRPNLLIIITICTVMMMLIVLGSTLSSVAAGAAAVHNDISTSSHITNQSNFITYRNADLGISMQYPSTFRTINITKNSQNPTILFVPIQKSFVDVILKIRHFSSNSSLFAYIANELMNKTNFLTRCGAENYSCYKLEYNSYQPYLVPSSQLKSTRILIFKDTKVYDMTFDAEYSLYQIFYSTIQKMIKSFDIFDGH